MTLKANVRKTVSGKHLRVGDIILNDQSFEGCEIDSVRPHTYEGEIDHVHLTLTRRDGTKVKTTALPEDRFDIERVITADDTERTKVSEVKATRVSLTVEQLDLIGDALENYRLLLRDTDALSIGLIKEKIRTLDALTDRLVGHRNKLQA